MTSPIVGLMAGFVTHEELLQAVQVARVAGYRQMDAYTPFPVEGLPEAMGLRSSGIPKIVLIAGITGGLGGYFMQWYASTIDYPINVGGRPLHSWPAFIPITFELTILCAAFSAMIAMLIMNRLPQPYHPVFNVPEFARATTDRFFLCVEASDEKFDLMATREFLATLRPYMIAEVPA